MNMMNKTLVAVALMLGGLISAEVMNVSPIRLANAAGDACGCAAATVEANPCGCAEGCSDGCAEQTPCCETEGCAATCETAGCTDRGCRAKGCLKGRCRPPRRQPACPSCAVECDTCTLELDHYEEERTCFKTEQKIVCIPPVRFPWDKCCPPGKSKTRTVNVLKIHKYKCKACGYKWKLDPLPEPCKPTAEPESPPAPEVETTPIIDPVVAPVENGMLLPPEGVAQPAFEPPVELESTPDVPAVPSSDDIPTPPNMSGN